MSIVNGFLYLLIPCILSFIFVPVCKKIGLSLGIYAIENKRTVHHGKIVRIGGLAIYMSFMVCMLLFVHPDSAINGILIGGFIIFMTGLVDDIYNLKAVYKFGLQIIAALVTIIVGDIQLDFINLIGLSFNVDLINIFVSIIWIAGVSNAINLIDGLDGLAAGISSIVLIVIALIGTFMYRYDIAILSLVLAGSTVGFLRYNFHPASIFMGDGGALFLGFMIACISLMGFKTSTFITLGFPIIILFVPLSDTLIAIIRRRLNGQKISEADRSHLHHILMYRIGLGHKKSVLVLYVVTILYGLVAIITFFNQQAGLIFLGFLLIASWIFIELTGMINSNFHPLIGFSRKTIGFPKKREGAFFEANRFYPKHILGADEIE
jgi:UDP-GlcNAc:undecaprenyl-phosphate GlcNAc-1-phosphate transferase